MIINRRETEKFLKALDSTTDKFTFQTFDDNDDRKDPSLVRIFNGTLAQHYEKLVELSKKGAGIYITVNETDLKGRTAENIKRVRYVFVDLDGAPLAPAKQPTPHIIVESSPKRWHVYWRVEGMVLEDFKAAQKRQIKRLGSDPKITDLPRVLRLPGFLHQKGKPFKTRVVNIWDGPAYPAAEFKGAIEKRKNKKFTSNLEPVDFEVLSTALDVIPADDYQIWLEVGAALRADIPDYDKGLEIFDRWSRKSDKYNKKQVAAKWDGIGDMTEFHIGTIYHYATKYEPNWRDAGTVFPADASIEDFVAYLPKHDYVYLPTGQHWPSTSVNTQLPKQQAGTKMIKPSEWLDRNRQVHAMTWAPGDPQLIPDRVARAEGGWIDKLGTTCLNLYLPPLVKTGDSAKAKRWINHVYELFPENAEHMLNWFAFKVQYPGIKINHGMLIGGEQGIGKDMILKPVRHAVGLWNCFNAAPKDIMGNYNTYIKSVILQIDEARDMGELKKYDFYEHLKTLTTAPPDILQCNEKYLSAYGVINCTGVIVTTNHRTGNIYLPPGDRRFYCVFSERTKEEFGVAYFNELEAYYMNGGYDHVAAYLRERDISKFNPKSPPPQTQAWHNIVAASKPSEDAEFAETLNILGSPDAVTIAQIMRATPDHSFALWLEDRRNRMKFGYRLESCGYVSAINPDSKQTRWQYRQTKNDGKSVVRETQIYVKSGLTFGQKIDAARKLLQQLSLDSLKS